jgi:hypothetical protein
VANYFVFSNTPKQGKAHEAIEALKEITKYYNENYAGTIEILRSMDGSTSRYHWLIKHESLAEWQETNAKWEQDPKQQEWAASIDDHWGDTEGHFYEIL